MKLKNKIFALISSFIFVTFAEVNQTSSVSFFKTVQNTANTCFKAVKYTGITLSVLLSVWGIKRFKDEGLYESAPALGGALLCAGLGYGAWRLEKWTDNKKDDQKKGNDNDLLHSDSGMQSK